MKKILAAGVSLVVFLIFWTIGLCVVIAAGVPILIGVLLWTILSGKVFQWVFNTLT